jgi:pimeloyl-ACP methyl ester carboxylesterase
VIDRSVKARQDGPMSSEAMAGANGIELCYETFGDPDGEPLLLVMGLGAQLIAWPIELCEALADRGFHVIRYDNRDVGRSTKIEGGSTDVMAALAAAQSGQSVQSLEVAYHLTDMAADAAGLLEALGIDSAHIVGASMGGMIAQTIAIEHPARVRTLTSVMSTTGEGSVGQPTPEAMGQLLQPPPTTREAAIANGVAASKVIGSPDDFDEDVARQRSALAYDRCFYPEGTARHLLAIVTSGDRAEGLRKVAVPTLVVHGDSDPLVTPSGGERTAELIPGATLLMLEGMGHDLPLRHIGAIVEAITGLAAQSVA